MKLIAILLLASVALSAQDKPSELPKLSDVLRQVESLKRENSKLKEDLRMRDTLLQLSAKEKALVIEEISRDRSEPDAAKARCERLAAQLRAIETPDATAVFKCDTLTFQKP